MRSERTRRALLASLAGSTTLLTGCYGDPGTNDDTSGPPSELPPSGNGPTRDPDSPTEGAIDPVEHDKLVGAYYYTWYNPANPFQEQTPAEPSLGYYRSADRDVIDQHVTWALEHGINWFNASWDGRNTPDDHAPEDEVLRTSFLDAELSHHIDFSIFYESNLTLTESDDGTLTFDLDANRETLRRDLQYLAETFFEEPNYLTVDGRPVVTFYAAHSFGGPVREAFADATAAIDHDPYLVAAVLGSTQNRTNGWMSAFDAVTGYNIYDEHVVANGDFADFVDYGDREMLEWTLVADHLDLDVVPVVTPGYDDTAVEERPGSRPVLERDPDGFGDLCRTVRDWVDPDLDAVMVTSFNEWPEFTAVEPATTYGTTYLEVVERELARKGDPDRPDVGGYAVVELDFDRTVPAPQEPVRFGMRLDAITLRDAAGEKLVSYDVGVLESEPHLLDGVFGPKSGSDGPFETWRWLGGPTGRTLLAFDPEYGDATTAEISCAAPPFAEESVGVTVTVDGRRTDHLSVTPDPDRYTASLVSK